MRRHVGGIILKGFLLASDLKRARTLCKGSEVAALEIGAPGNCTNVVEGEWRSSSGSREYKIIEDTSGSESIPGS